MSCDFAFMPAGAQSLRAGRGGGGLRKQQKPVARLRRSGVPFGLTAGRFDSLRFPCAVVKTSQDCWSAARGGGCQVLLGPQGQGDESSRLKSNRLKAGWERVAAQWSWL